MILRLDLPSLTSKQLKPITRAIYIVKSTNEAFPDLYSCGAAGVREGQKGNLFQRLQSHAKNRQSEYRADGSQLYRHETSPFGIRVWALHLVGWSELGVQLAEHALHFRLSLEFPFVGDSCFLAHSDPEVEKVGNAIIPDLEKIKTAGNSAANRNNKLPKLKMAPASASP